MSKLPLTSLVAEEKYQPRSMMDLVTIQRYAEKMRAGVIFPPILVGKRREKFVILDGWHRVAAAKRSGRDSVEARITTEPEAKWLALVFEENAQHGLALSQSDVMNGMKRLKETGYGIQEVARVFRVRPELVERIVAQRVERQPLEVVGKATDPMRGHRLKMPMLSIGEQVPELFAPVTLPPEEANGRVKDFLTFLDDNQHILQNDVGIALLVQVQSRIVGIVESGVGVKK